MVTYPQEWKTCNIGQCVNIYQGGTPKTSNATYWGGDIVWVTPSEITKLSGLYISKSERTITQEGLNNSSATLLPKGTILLCTRATIGDLAIAAIPLTTNQGFKNLTCHKGIYNLFFAYMLSTYKDEMVSKAIGTTFLEISKKELEKIVVHIPPYEEQKAIANCLSSFDTYIDDLAELIEKKRSIRDGALEELMSGRTRLQGFTMDWIVYPFNKYFSLLPTNTFSRDQLSSKGQVGNIHYGDVLIKYGDVLSDTDEIPRLKDTSQIKERSYLQIHDVLIADTAEDDTVGKVVQVGKVSIPIVGGLHTVACRPNYETAEGFLGYYMNSSLYHDQLYPYITGIKVSSVSKKSFGETELCIPVEVEEQEAIVSVLKEMDEEIEALEIERDKMIQIREGAMDDLLTGRVRLRV